MKEKAKNKVVEVLNDVLTAELTAINQYFLHGELCSHWGFQKLGAVVKKQSIDEMKHAHLLIERILFLDGLPNVQRLGKINIGESVTEMYKADMALEVEAVERLAEGIQVCIDAGDHGSRALLEAILASEEQHMEWLHTQQAAMQAVGEANYLATLVVV